MAPLPHDLHCRNNWQREHREHFRFSILMIMSNLSSIWSFFVNYFFILFIFWYCQGWVKVLWLQNIQGMSVWQQASSRNERRKIVCFILRDSLLTNSSFVISLPLWTTKALLLLSKIFSSCLYQVVLLEDRDSCYVCRTLPCTCSHLVHCGQVYGLLATHLPLTPPSFPLLPLFPHLVLLLLWEGIWGGPNLLINKSWVRSPHISVSGFMRRWVTLSPDHVVPNSLQRT